MHTQQSLEQLTVKELRTIASEMEMPTKGGRKKLIQNILLSQDFGSTDELRAIVAETGLSTNGDRRDLIENVILARRFPEFIEQVKAEKALKAKQPN